MGQAPGDPGGVPDRFKDGFLPTPAEGDRTHAHHGPERSNELEAELLREPVGAVGVRHAHHEAVTLGGRPIVGRLRQPGEQTLAAVIGVGGRVQREQASFLLPMYPCPQGNGDVVSGQDVAGPGVEAHGPALGVVQVLPTDHLVGEVQRFREHGPEKVADAGYPGLVQVQRAQLVFGHVPKASTGDLLLR